MTLSSRLHQGSVVCLLFGCLVCPPRVPLSCALSCANWHTRPGSLQQEAGLVPVRKAYPSYTLLLGPAGRAGPGQGKAPRCRAEGGTGHAMPCHSEGGALQGGDGDAMPCHSDAPHTHISQHCFQGSPCASPPPCPPLPLCAHPCGPPAPPEGAGGGCQVPAGPCPGTRGGGLGPGSWPGPAPQLGARGGGGGLTPYACIGEAHQGRAAGGTGKHTYTHRGYSRALPMALPYTHRGYSRALPMALPRRPALLGLALNPSLSPDKGAFGPAPVPMPAPCCLNRWCCRT